MPRQVVCTTGSRARWLRAAAMVLSEPNRLAIRAKPMPMLAPLDGSKATISRQNTSATEPDEGAEQHAGANRHPQEQRAEEYVVDDEERDDERHKAAGEVAHPVVEKDVHQAEHRDPLQGDEKVVSRAVACRAPARHARRQQDHCAEAEAVGD